MVHILIISSHEENWLHYWKKPKPASINHFICKLRVWRISDFLAWKEDKHFNQVSDRVMKEFIITILKVAITVKEQWHDLFQIDLSFVLLYFFFILSLRHQVTRGNVNVTVGVLHFQEPSAWGVYRDCRSPESNEVLRNICLSNTSFVNQSPFFIILE